MFGIGLMELVIIAVVALVFVGPSRLPELIRTAAKFFVQARRMSSDIKAGFDDAIFKAEAEMIRKEREDMKRLLHSAPARRIDETIAPEGTVSHHDPGEVDSTEAIAPNPEKES